MSALESISNDLGGTEAAALEVTGLELHPIEHTQGAGLKRVGQEVDKWPVLALFRHSHCWRPLGDYRSHF